MTKEFFIMLPDGLWRAKGEILTHNGKEYGINPTNPRPYRKEKYALTDLETGATIGYGLTKKEIKDNAERCFSLVDEFLSTDEGKKKYEGHKSNFQYLMEHFQSSLITAPQHDKIGAYLVGNE